MGAPELASHEIDFTQDRRDWEAMPDEEREEISWGLANFFVGEERVATQFSGLVMAYEAQHEEAFLTTQQVDEARHAQHFNRLYENVLSTTAASRTAWPAAASSSTSATSRSSTSTSSTPTRRSSTTRATSRPRSTSS